MKHALFATAALALLLAGCNREAEPEAPAADTATPAAQAPRPRRPSRRMPWPTRPRAPTPSR